MALALRCQDGDPGAFEELYRAYSPRLFGLACRMVGRTDAEDLLQEIFLTAHRKLSLHKGESSLGTWLFRLATNLCLDFLRSRATRSAQVTDSYDAWTGGYGDHGDMRGSRQRNFPASQTDKETRTFAIGAKGEFSLDNLSGNIHIRPGSGRELTIDITRVSRGRTEADAKTGLARVRVETTHRGERATARTEYPQNERQSSYSVSVDYIVTAPAGTRVTAKTLSGNVTVGAMTGDLTINAVSGDVQISGATRLIHAKTVSGEVTLQNCESTDVLDASTMSGDVTGTNLKARRVQLQSISGNVTGRNVTAQSAKLHSMSSNVVSEGDLAAGGRYEFTTHSGTVRLALDGRTGFSLHATTFSGSVRSDLPLKVDNVGTGRRATRNMRGTFGDGSATITASSFSGSVIVTKR